MDIRTLANKYPSIGPELAAGTAREQGKALSREEFVELMAQAHQRRADGTETSQELLYAGSAQRRTPSDAEIAALANRYDPHSMDRETYSSFLDDLVDMGAISQYEKLLMGYNGSMELGYVHADGELNQISGPLFGYPVPNDSEAPNSIAEADGDVLGWLRHMLSRQDVVLGNLDHGAMERNRERFEAVSGILERMEALQASRSGEDQERAELLRQLADPNSDFYADILETLRFKMEEREDQEREQAIIDALGSVLDAMSGKRDTHRSDIPLSLSEITRQIGELDPQDPERVRLELFLQRLNELGIYFDPTDLTGGREDEESGFETLTQLLVRRQREQTDSSR